jgi:hypothetical protein
MLVTNTEKYPTKIHWYRKNTTLLLAVFQKVNFSKVVDIKNRNQVIKLSGFPANPHQPFSIPHNQCKEVSDAVAKYVRLNM